MHPANGISQNGREQWRVSYPETGEDNVGFSPLLPGWIKGYLSEDILLQAGSILSRPPLEDSAEYHVDQACYRFIQAVSPANRRLNAEQDADLSWRSLGKSFSASAGVTISRTATPALHKVMNRLLTDAAITVFTVKSRYPRMRPDPRLPYDSWPSGHATTGRLWALMLSDVFPQNASRMERRSLEFGESRIICHAHWHSDVCAGYRLAEYLYAQLLQNALYLEQVAGAKKEQYRGSRKQ